MVNIKKYWRNNGIIYHGGCLKCCSQHLFGKNRCLGCQYKNPNWNLQDLSIEGPPTDKSFLRKLRKLKIEQINNKNERNSKESKRSFY